MQAAIHENHLNKGISKKLLTLLKKIVSQRFDYLSGIIIKENYEAIIKQHLSAGWQVIGEFDFGHIAIMPTKD